MHTSRGSVSMHIRMCGFQAWEQQASPALYSPRPQVPASVYMRIRVHWARSLDPEVNRAANIETEITIAYYY